MFDRRNLLWGRRRARRFPDCLARAIEDLRRRALPGLTSMTGIGVNAVMEGCATGFREYRRPIEILARASEGDPARLAPLAADLVEQKVDAIVPISPSAVRSQGRDHYDPGRRQRHGERSRSQQFRPEPVASRRQYYRRVFRFPNSGQMDRAAERGCTHGCPKS